MAVDSKSYAFPNVATGIFTTAASAVAVTETLGFDPGMVIVFITDGTNINIHIAHNGDTVNHYLVTGSSGITTEQVVANGVDISGRTFIVAAAAQTVNEVVWWIAFR